MSRTQRPAEEGLLGSFLGFVGIRKGVDVRVTLTSGREVIGKVTSTQEGYNAVAHLAALLVRPHGHPYDVLIPWPQVEQLSGALPPEVTP